MSKKKEEEICFYDKMDVKSNENGWKLKQNAFFKPNNLNSQ